MSRTGGAAEHPGGGGEYTYVPYTKIRPPTDLEPDLSAWNVIKVFGLFGTTNIEFTIYEMLFDESPQSVKPNLFVMSGFSVDSVLECAPIILDKLDVLSTKYRGVYIINQAPFKDAQEAAVQAKKQLQLPETEKANKFKYREDKNAAEIEMNNHISKTIDILIGKIGLSNVHLLGKCAGGGVAISLVERSKPRYTGLFLAVPSCATNINTLSADVLDNVMIRVNWNLNDSYAYPWQKDEGEGEYSVDEKPIYDKTIERFMKEGRRINYVSFMFSPDIKTLEYKTPSHRKPGHEIHRKFIDYIVAEL